jgi:hypothetical protein
MISPMTTLDVSNGHVSNGTITADSSSTSDIFTIGQVVGVGAGIGAPLLACLIAATIVIVRQRKRLENLRSTSTAEKVDRESTTSAYTHLIPQQMHQQVQSPPFQSPQFNGYQAYQVPPPMHGHFREVQLNELDAVATPQELDQPKPDHRR